MTDAVSLHADPSRLTESVAEAGAEIERVAREQIAPAAALIDEAFAVAASSIQSNLSRAAKGGEISLKGLARALVRDLSRLAIDAFVREPVRNLVTNLLTAPFGGARAAGGFAAPGQAFLVGERGPELFAPSQSGAIRPLSASPVIVNITLPGVADVESFRRSQTQIAAALARVVGRGRRNL
jgi:phage-related minor tail protein